MTHTFRFLSAIFLGSLSALAQQPDPAFYGLWTQDVAKSSFGLQTPPKVAQLIITPQGWVTATLDAEGDLSAMAVSKGPDGSCVVIGLPPGFSCRQEIADARHGSWTLKYEDQIVQAATMELLDHLTMKSTITLSPPGMAPYTIVAIWRKTPDRFVTAKSISDQK
jgi:hypothetical protein